MNQTLIKLSETHYIIVDDSEVREGDWCAYNKSHNSKKPQWEIVQCGSIEREEMHPISEGRLLLWMKKITHSTQPLDKDIHGFGYWTKDIIPLYLSEVEELVLGYSVEKMAEDNWNSDSYNGELFDNQKDGYCAGYWEGFNAAMELVKDKLFTVEDMRKAVLKGRIRGGNISPKYAIEDIIQSLLPPTQWPVTFDEQGKLKLV